MENGGNAINPHHRRVTESRGCAKASKVKEREGSNMRYRGPTGAGGRRRVGEEMKQVAEEEKG